MLSWDERLMIGLKVLERLRPTQRARSLPGGGPLSKDTLDLEATTTVDAASGDAEADPRLPAGDDTQSPADEWQQPRASAYELPSLEALLEQAGELSPYSIILGICEDGLPFLLDLTNPAPGALLITGDHQSGKTRLLKSILASATYLNPPDQVAFYLVAHYPWQYAELAETDHCQGLQATNENTLGELIEELAQLVEDHRRSGPDGPAIILAIDALHACLQAIDARTFARLYWLIRHGPRSRVWTIANFDTQRAEQFDPRFLAAFRTRLVGSIADRKQAASISNDQRLDTRRIEKGYEFCVPYGEQWTHFWICDPEAPIEPEIEGTLSSLEGETEQSIN